MVRAGKAEDAAGPRGRRPRRQPLRAGADPQLLTTTPGGPPLLILGVRRSGTTLLRVMLDRHSQLAVPDESYFVPQLADRHLRRVDPDDFVDDLRRLNTLTEWDVPLDEVRDASPSTTCRSGRRSRPSTRSTPRQRGKARWGDKTPMYMQNLRLLERLFPDALFVHLIRDGRDAALSFLEMPRGLVTETWMHPRTPADFASQWRTEVAAARRLGRRVGPRYVEVRYEELVADVGGGAATHLRVRRAGVRAGHGGLRGQRRRLGEAAPAAAHAAADLRCAGLADADVARRRRRVRARCGRSAARARLRDVRSRTTAAGRLRRASYASRALAWRGASFALRRSPLWRRRHPPLR